MNRTAAMIFPFAMIVSFASVSAPGGEDGAPLILGAPPEREVEVAWNRFYDHAGCTDILKRINRAHPELTRLYSIGRSHEGRDIWCLEVTNFKKGDPTAKAGMYIDGNIHGNEVQASEVVLYTAWYLTESYGKNGFVTGLLDDRVFYLIPSINPDGRDHWFHDANTPHSSRGGKKPVDNDRDGRLDEDGYDDLDGDGSITQMFLRDPNGRYRLHPEYPEYLMERVDEDERGEYTRLGWEGIDNDGDGEVNEDGPGGYDSNRNWAYDWQPNYVQYGAHDYPFSLPNTRAAAEFVMARPNIAAGQSYHNTGGMILRNPGREGGAMHPSDDRVMEAIARRGERMLPFYRSMVIWRDLYTVWGGEVDWFYGARGVMMYTNELWTSRNLYRDGGGGPEGEVEFMQHLLHGGGLAEFREYDHPTYGTVLVGGVRKEFGRVPPSFLLEEECHRNMAFTLYHADQMPKLEFGEIEAKSLGGDVYAVRVEVRNARMMPSRSAHGAENGISPPDRVWVSGESVTPVSSGLVTDRHFGKVVPSKARPNRVDLPPVGGLSSEWAEFVVEGSGDMVIAVEPARGERLETVFSLE